MKKMKSWVAFALFAFTCTVATRVQSQDSRFAPTTAGVGLVNPSYLVDFDEGARIAHWVHYELRAAESNGPYSRTDDFRRDPRAASSADADSYRGSGYDRGHLKPAGDSKSSRAEMSQSFLMTNMFPQTASLNRGVWRVLEQDVRGWSVQYGAVHVSTGPSVESKGRIGGNTGGGVRVPSACWKAVLRTSPDTSAIAFWMPNDAQVNGNAADYVITVDALEARIEIDLFPGLPDATEARVEASDASGEWAMSTGGGFARSGVQCLGVGSSTGRRCGNFTNNANQHCHLHQAQVGGGDGDDSSASPPPRSGTSQQCTGHAKSTGQRCRNMTTHPSGRCHHHRD